MFKEVNKFLSKKISREDFVKVSAIGLISLAGASFFNKLNFEGIFDRRKETEASYGNGNYGGR
jgi:hypothetical protein